VGGKESQCIFAVPRALRAWRARCKKYEAEDFGGKDFRKVCILYVRLPVSSLGRGIMVSETILFAFGFDRPAGNIAPFIHRTPIAGCGFDRQTLTGLRIGFFLLFSLLSLTVE